METTPENNNMKGTSPSPRLEDFLRSGSMTINNEQATSRGGIELRHAESEDTPEHPTEKDVEMIQSELADSLTAEILMIDRQVVLYEENRDLKIAIERAEADRKLSELQNLREHIRAQLEATALKK